MKKSQWDNMSLTEKIRWRNKHPVKNSWFFADKILAKDIALQRAPECKANKIIYIPSKLEDIDINKLPENYIFKANHGSGWLIKVKNGLNARTGEKITDEILIRYAKNWLSKIYGHGHEKQYLLIEPQVFFEEFLEDFFEFRFFCFDGKVRFIMVDVDTSTGTKSVIYGIDWKKINAHWRDPEGTDIKRPKNLDKFIHIVEQLASDIDFIRIDTYIKGNDIYFGEFTFTPNAGGAKINPSEFDMLWGSYWTHDMSNLKGLKIPFGTGYLSVSSKIGTKAHMNSRIFVHKVKRALGRF